MAEGITFDMSGWDKKSAAVQAALKEAIKRSIDFGMDEVNKEAAKNLAGPSYGVGGRGPMTGQMPIPRQTGNLANSLRTRRINYASGYVSSAADKAKYNIYVHDGTRRMRARPFLTDAVRGKKEAVLRRWKNETILAIRRAGR